MEAPETHEAPKAPKAPKIKAKLNPVYALSSNTTVVNVKVDHLRKRKQYNNISEWLSDNNNAYIGRQARINVDGTYVGIKKSLWANDYTVKDHGREGALRLYKEKQIARLTQDPLWVSRLAELKGKSLGCWCSPEPCHGDVLLELIAIYCP